MHTEYKSLVSGYKSHVNYLITRSDCVKYRICRSCYATWPNM